MIPEKHFAAANRAAVRAADKIERAIASMLSATPDEVAPDYVIERLGVELIDRNPAALDWLNRQLGDNSMRLANTLISTSLFRLKLAASESLLEVPEGLPSKLTAAIP